MGGGDNANVPTFSAIPVMVVRSLLAARKSFPGEGRGGGSKRPDPLEAVSYQCLG